MLNERCHWMQTAAHLMGLWFSRTGWRLERIVQRLSTVLISAVLLSACDGAGPASDRTFSGRSTRDRAPSYYRDAGRDLHLVWHHLRSDVNRANTH